VGPIGGAFDLDGIHIWNGNQSYDLAHIQRGVNEFVLSVSIDGGASYTNVSTYNLAISPYPPAAANSAQTFDLTGRNGITYVFVLANGLNAGREVAVVSWSGNTITVAEDIESDVTWDGDYEVRTPTPAETEWIDTAPPAAKAFYRVGRR
jgi:hypothetical protein